MVFDLPLPKLDCTIVCPPDGPCLDLSLRCTLVPPTAARVHAAEAETRDFRLAWWEPSALELNGDKAVCRVQPKTRHAAAVLELEFDLDGLRYTLSTPLRILEPKK
jgi:hypothetical protein